jgi:hypothetical protein
LTTVAVLVVASGVFLFARQIWHAVLRLHGH